jgi:hypothetical protein
MNVEKVNMEKEPTLHDIVVKCAKCSEKLARLKETILNINEVIDNDVEAFTRDRPVANSNEKATPIKCANIRFDLLSTVNIIDSLLAECDNLLYSTRSKLYTGQVNVKVPPSCGCSY